MLGPSLSVWVWLGSRRLLARSARSAYKPIIPPGATGVEIPTVVLRYLKNPQCGCVSVGNTSDGLFDKIVKALR
jgi:hypothetical protein